MKKIILILSSLLLSSVVMAAANTVAPTEEAPATTLQPGGPQDITNAGNCEICNQQAANLELFADKSTNPKEAVNFVTDALSAGGKGANIDANDKQDTDK